MPTVFSVSSTTVTTAESTASRTLTLLLRLSMAWVFLYAASHQVLVPGWSVAGFLNSTKTFHWLFGPMAAPVPAAILTVLVEYGHLLIGLSLLTGLLVRLSSILGIFIMLVYWLAHMDFPYIGDTTNFLLDEHIVYALVLGTLIARHAGHIWGLDAWAARLEPVHNHKWLDWVTA
jgi:thiosulfate dehydrogenase [quinone] large subunit